MVYWNEPADEHAALLNAPTLVDGFPTPSRDARRATPSGPGRDVSSIDFYVAFGYWKLACIVEGVYARYAGGAMGDDADGFEAFGQQVERLVAGREPSARPAVRHRMTSTSSSSGRTSSRRCWCSPSTAGSTPDSAPRTRPGRSSSGPAVTVAVFDSDELLDHRARRPIMHLSTA